MTLTHDEKKSIINAHFRDIRSNLFILQSMGGRHGDHKNAVEMITEAGIQNVADASDLFDELMDDWVTDPAVDLIDAYQAAEVAYNACPEDDTARLEGLRMGHDASIEAIMETDLKVITIRGVEAALRQALDEEKISPHRSLTVALLEMAVGYFDGRAVDKSNNGENC